MSWGHTEHGDVRGDIADRVQGRDLRSHGTVCHGLRQLTQDHQTPDGDKLLPMLAGYR